MKRRVGMAAAGALLAAGLAGGTSFGVVHHHSAFGTHVASCARLEAQIEQLRGFKQAATDTGQTALATQLATQIALLQAQFTAHC